MHPRFPVIDAHTHIAGSCALPMLKLMDDVGLEQVVVLANAGADLAEEIPAFRQASPDRFVVFTAPPLEEATRPGGGARLVRFLEQEVRLGAAGIKVYKEFGLRYQDAQGRRLPVDDPRLDPLWQRAGELGLPVLIHTGDPADFWKPFDATNPRWEELQVHPDWWFGGGRFPPLATLLAERDRLVARHPQVRFIGAHLASLPHDLDALEETLARLPNLWVDLAARIGEIGCQERERVRAFFLRHADRILFATDTMAGTFGKAAAPGAERRHFFDLHWRYLEGDEQALEPPEPLQGRQPLHSLGLPEEILQKVYSANARGLLEGRN